MGTCHIHVNSELRDRIKTDPHLSDLISIITESLFDDDGLWIMKVSSPLLPAGYQFQQDLIVEGSNVRFARSLDV